MMSQGQVGSVEYLLVFLWRFVWNQNDDQCLRLPNKWWSHVLQSRVHYLSSTRFFETSTCVANSLECILSSLLHS
jgi:hypothetical protein